MNTAALPLLVLSVAPNANTNTNTNTDVHKTTIERIARERGWALTDYDFSSAEELRRGLLTAELRLADDAQRERPGLIVMVMTPETSAAARGAQGRHLSVGSFSSDSPAQRKRHSERLLQRVLDRAPLDAMNGKSLARALRAAGASIAGEVLHEDLTDMDQGMSWHVDVRFRGEDYVVRLWDYSRLVRDGRSLVDRARIACVIITGGPPEAREAMVPEARALFKALKKVGVFDLSASD